MKAKPALRATLYLLFSLFGMLVGGFFPTPYSTLCHLLLVFLALYTEKRFFAGDALPSLSLCELWRARRISLLIPAFLFLSLAVNLLAAKWTVALGGSLPDMTPTPRLLIGAVIIAPIAEELLFRGLILRLLRHFGDGWAIAISALLFALAHTSLFQMPYALVAGVMLGVLAVGSGGVLLPIFAHFVYNLLAFFGDRIPSLPFLWSLGGLALFSTVLFFLGGHPLSLQKGERPDGRALFPLLLYAAFTLALTILNF